MNRSILDEMSPRHPTTRISLAACWSDQGKFVEIALGDELALRDARRSEAVAVGSLAFVEKVKAS
jgi:hypothetical protein